MKNLQIYDTKKKNETCILVGIVKKSVERRTVENNLNELRSLAETAGLVVIKRITQERIKLNPSFFLGKGKTFEIAGDIKNQDVDIIIFDDELSPAQLRNWEKITSLKILDRSNLILDIFASNARTKESKSQVELAQLLYLLPRLTKQWTHLSRQFGGVGTKGPGETQLETDRRLVRNRISHLKKELNKIEKTHYTKRKKSNQMICASLIGYTNSGKSTLLNILTSSKTLVQDSLFSTLETTTRRYLLNRKDVILLSDTVGFIKKLPHHLIASFQSTLSQTRDADLLFHIVDISDPNFTDHIRVVDDLISQINNEIKPKIMLFNKVDKIDGDGIISQVKMMYPKALFISAKHNIRLDKIGVLCSAMVKKIKNRSVK